MNSEVKHRRVRTNGIWMHIAEQGSGPLLLLLHGFPELWFSWRHQITHLAAKGFHVVAPDMRGYGDTDSPPHHSSYTYFHLVGDIIGLLDDLNQQQAFVVGHDWGALVGWHLSLFRPDRVRGFVSLSVAFPRPSFMSAAFMTKTFGDGLYISQFQEPGRAEKAFGRYDCSTVMKKFLLIDKDDPLIAPPGVETIDFLHTPSSLPSWISEDEIRFFTQKFEETGFTGGLNYYRAMDLNCELLGPWNGSKVTVPVKLIVGDKDIGFSVYTKSYIEGPVLKDLVPNLEVVVLADAHHFIQQERPQEITDEILSFIAKLSS
ncbi:hypothetical protein Sjap_016980 [Stephania japonica]|uniref:soluble epoxide hydrolase n=1 Tax=Stephania japonica TaxID=461633 RepID=A0AAP0I5A2_9MAGN